MEAAAHRLPWWGRVLVVGAAWWAAAALVYAVVMTVFFVVLATFDLTRPHPLTTSLQSPDGLYLAELREVPASWDRNFEVIVRERNTRRSKKILHRSPDEGPAGTERFVWSDDSARCLLLGRSFLSVAQTISATGEQAYLLYDTRDGTLRCNSPQASLPRFGEGDLAGFTFVAATAAPSSVPTTTSTATN